jgi:hypothetical protein
MEKMKRDEKHQKRIAQFKSITEPNYSTVESKIEQDNLKRRNYRQHILNTHRKITSEPLSERARFCFYSRLSQLNDDETTMAQLVCS